LEQLPIYTPLGSQITLGTVAKIKVNDGPPMLKSENARPSGWVYIDVRGRDIASVVADLRRLVSEQVKLQPGMSLSYSGQFEFLERANARLKLVVPATLLIIFVLLYLTFARFDEALLIMATLPFALTGGMVPLSVGIQPVGCHRGRLYRPGRSFCRIWRDHAALPEKCLGRTCKTSVTTLNVG
jgi:copper/silver efflux system protein